MPLRVAIDVGGTFTDLCALDERTGKFTFVKDSTTPANYATGVIKVVRKSGIRGEQIDRFIGTGSTMVINALTERKGAKTILVTTKGFRDVLELQRSNRTDLYNMRYMKPVAFVPRRLRLEVDERVGFSGEVTRQLNRIDVARIIDICQREHVEAVAIALYNAYANPVNEIECYKMLDGHVGTKYITMSHELSREWREYERVNTAVLNAFVQPKVHEYLTNLESELKRLGAKITPHVMQSNGGVAPFEQGKRTPIYQVESGPIGGVIGAQVVGRALKISNLVTLDVGGTTAKTSLIDSGRIKINTEYNVGRTQFFAGYPIKAPVVDIVEIGAGGGSIAWIDDLGALKVGPQSAGADPGPACINRGGDKPTLTDAFVLTGVIHPDYFLGGEIKLKPELSKKAYETLGERLELKPVEVAMGAIKIATANMVNAIKLVSVRRGYDPRDFAIVAFGGGGPMFATALAEELGVKKVVVPSVPGVFSAWGMLMTDLRHDYIRTRVTPLNPTTAGTLQTIVDEMRTEGKAQLVEEQVAPKDMGFEVFFDVRYAGQEHTVATPVGVDIESKGALQEIEKRFHDLHFKAYTFRLEDPLEVVNVRVSAFGRVRRASLTKLSRQRKRPRPKGKRKIRLDESGPALVPVYERGDIPVGATINGPAIIEEPTSTTIIRKGNKLTHEAFGNLIIEV